MESQAHVRRCVSFGSFQLDLATGELRKHGMRLKLQEQSLSILRLMLERNGELITREEFRRHLWPGATYVEFDTGLNSAIRRVRTVLGDEAEDPQFIETVSRRGYRFIAPVQFTERTEAPGTTESGTIALPSALQPNVAGHPERTYRIWRWAAFATIVALGLAVAIALVSIRASRRQELNFKQITFQDRAITGAAFAADERTTIYSSRTEDGLSKVYLSRPDHAEALPIGVEGEVLAVSSRDEIALALGRHSRHSPFTLATVPVGGGRPREVALQARSADWMPDGVTMALARVVEGKDVVEFPAGTQAYISMGWISNLRVSPDGGAVAFWEHPRQANAAGRLMLLERDGARRRLTDVYGSAHGLAWSPDGRQIWFTAGEYVGDRRLYVISARGGKPVLTRQFAQSMALKDIAADGTLLLVSGRRRFSIRAHRTGTSEEQDLSLFDGAWARSISQDGKLLAFDQMGQAGGQRNSIYVRDLDSGHAVRIGEGSALAISPDKQWVVAHEPGAGSTPFLLPTGVGKRRELGAIGSSSVYWAAWHPDGKHILFAAGGGEEAKQLYWKDLESGAATAINTGIARRPGALSHDGRSLAAIKHDGRLVVISVPDGKERTVARGEQLAIMGWSADDQSLFVHDAGSAPISIQKLDVQTGRFQPWQHLNPTDASDLVSVDPVLVSADGSTIVYNQMELPSDLFLAQFPD